MKKALLSLLPAFLLTSCTISLGHFNVSVSYKDEDKYVIGDLITNSEIKDIEINYLNGHISIVPSTDDAFKAVETTSKEVEDDVKMRYYVSGTTLYIQPAKSGTRVYGNATRNLSIEIPTNYTMNSIEIDSVSSDIDINVDATFLELNTVSGEGKMKVGSFSTIKVDTVSMDVEVNITSDIGVEVDIDTISGKLDNQISKVDHLHRIDFDSVSGDLTIKRV